MNPDTPWSDATPNNPREERAGEAASSGPVPALSDAVPGVEEGAASSGGTGPTDRPAARKVVARLKDQTATQLSAQKRRATSALESVVAAAHDTSRHLRDERRTAAASVVEGAAKQLDRLAEQLRSKDLEELADEARRFARERPAVFIGTSLVAGFVATRFARSSTVDRGWRDERNESARRRGATGERSESRDDSARRGWPGDSHADSGAPRGSF
jgi:hypothetical protein